MGVLIPKFSVFFGFLLRTQKLRIFIWTILLSPVIMYSCVEITKESPGQHRNTDLIDAEFAEIRKKDSSLLPQKYGWLMFAKVCRDAKPSISQDNCLHMAIEGPDMTTAKRNVEQFAIVINAVFIKKLGTRMRGAVIVLTPVVREKGYSGDITDFAVGKYFETDDPTIVKIGE